MSRLHWGCGFSHGFLNVFKRLKLRGNMVSLLRERKVTLFLSLCIWLPALSFLCPSQTMNREFGGVSCRPAVVSLLESLSYKWRAQAGWEVMSYWWLISADGGKKWLLSELGLFPKKESITLEKRLMENIQQLCWPLDRGLHWSHRMRRFVSCDYLYLPLTSTFVSPKQSGCMICYFLFFIKF